MFRLQFKYVIFFSHIHYHKYDTWCFFLPDVGAQTAPCNVNSITIKDPLTGSVQCQDCRKCPAAHGLSVKCGDVISLNTPLVCKPCVLGETYSSAYEAGACKDCENCGQYRETKKACTLTSNAECGKCKLGAYEEFMLGMCKPCSPCCNDGKDIVVPDCQVPGIPKNMQCSFARSLKCSTVVAEASVSTVASTLRTSRSTFSSMIASNATSTVVTSHTSELLAKLPYGASPPQNVIVGSVIGGVFVVVILPLVAIRCFIVKRRRVRKKASDGEIVENGMGKRPDHVQGDDQANDEPRPSEDLSEKTSAPVQESQHRDDSQYQTGNETNNLNSAEDLSEKIPVQEESSAESQEQTGTKETGPPGRSGNTGKPRCYHD